MSMINVLAKEFENKQYETAVFTRPCIDKEEIVKIPYSVRPPPNRQLGVDQHERTEISSNAFLTATDGETNNWHKRTRDDEDNLTSDRLFKKCRGNTDTASASAIAEKQNSTADILLTGTVAIGSACDSGTLNGPFSDASFSCQWSNAEGYAYSFNFLKELPLFVLTINILQCFTLENENVLELRSLGV